MTAERLSWSSSNSAGAFASPLKLPMAGLRNRSNGLPYNVDFSGYYWSSTVFGTIARNMVFSSFAGTFNDTRAFGMSVRCIKD